MNKEIICGIYKITSPTNRSYIGQSINIIKRWGEYKRLSCKYQDKLYKSFLKYGIENHKFEIIQKCSIEELNTLEEKYVLEFKCVEEGLNIRYGGGARGKVSEETKNKLRIINLGKKWSEESKLKQSLATRGEKNPNFGKKASLETKQKQLIKRLGRKVSEKTRFKMSESRKGKKLSIETIEKSAKSRTGLKRSEEFKQKIRSIKLGKKLPPETILKMVKSRTGLKRSEETKKKMSLAALGKKKNPESVKKSADSKRGIPHSDEAKLKISLAMKGNKNPMFGRSGIKSPNFGKKISKEVLDKVSGDNHWTRKKGISLETRTKQSIAKKGIKQSPESIEKRVKAMKLTWEKKRQLLNN